MKNVNALTECLYNEDAQVRVLGTKNEPWFVAVDVFRILEISLKNMSRALEKLDDDEKMVVDLTTNSAEKQNASPFKLKGEKTEIVQGSHNTVWIISEPGLYKIMLSSRSEKAKQFTRWVTHDVLPRIRKYGYYKLSVEERKSAAYKKIAKLRGEEELANKEYAKMSVYSLEMKVRSFEAQDALEIERADVVKKYPYTYNEADKWCQGELEYIRLFIPKGEEDKYYRVTGSFFDSREHFSEKFKRDVPKLMKKAYGGQKKLQFFIKYVRLGKKV